MATSKAIEKYVEEELPYQLLMQLYENSRTPLRRVGRTVGISHYTISKVLRRLEARYDINYTLELDPHALGFSTGKLIMIRFGIVPDVAFLKKLFNESEDSIYVQDAYLATGDFDLVLYVVGLTPEDFQWWQFNLRVKFSKYKPRFSFSDVSLNVDGFFPLKSELIKKSERLTNVEKKILVMLNDNSRIRIESIAKKSRLTRAF